MTQTDSETKVDQNYLAAHFGLFEKLNQYKFGHEGLPSSLSRHPQINTSLAFPSMMVLAKTTRHLARDV